MTLYSLVFTLLFSVMSFASDHDETKIQVRMGFGKVDLFWVPPANLSEEKVDEVKKILDQLETQLLVDEGIATVVTGSNQVTFNIEIDEDDLSYQSEELSREIEEEIKEHLLSQVMVTGDEGQGIIAEGLRRVVMGSHLLVEEDEYLEEVVVIAGSADIKGTVDRLVILGGDVRLHSTAKIQKELSSMGGNVERDQGAQIRGQSNSIGNPLSDQSWNLIFNKFKTTEFGEVFTSKYTLLVFSLFKILAMLIFAMIGQYIAPKYQNHVQKYLRQNPVTCLLWGGISIMLVLPTTMLLVLSVVGIPLMPLQFSIYFLFFIFGYIRMAQFVGEFVIEKLKHKEKLSIMAFVAIGLVILELVAQVPMIGGWVKWICVFAGFGAASKIFYQQTLMPMKRRYS